MTVQLDSLMVADVMSVDPITVSVDQTIEEAQELLRLNHITGLPVVDGDGRLVGVLSQSDLVWGPGLHVATLLRRKPSGLRVGELMTSPALTVRMDTPIVEAARRMIAARVHRLVAVDRVGRPVGVLSATDFVALAAEG
ncbi:MAG TPA: CBS domain-containing protein [candidate division Zixibacteria bacterium]|nr:CBS domain-containing protein [candidate division Zixibacteria bacterium]